MRYEAGQIPEITRTPHIIVIGDLGNPNQARALAYELGKEEGVTVGVFTPSRSNPSIAEMRRTLDRLIAKADEKAIVTLVGLEAFGSNLAFMACAENPGTQVFAIAPKGDGTPASLGKAQDPLVHAVALMAERDIANIKSPVFVMRPDAEVTRVNALGQTYQTPFVTRLNAPGVVRYTTYGAVDRPVTTHLMTSDRRTASIITRFAKSSR